MKADRFSRFEDQIQRLVEGGFARLFAGRLHPREVAVQLARAMEDHVLEGTDGQLVAPDVYIVRLNPDDQQAILSSDMELAQALAAELVEMARSASLTMSRFPEVRLLADHDISPHAIAVSAQHATRHRETTQSLPLAQVEEAAIATPPVAALILNGEQHVPLTKPIVNLGRQRDNDIIVDDIRVSRHHAQIRLRFGSYVLFDLGSTGGTTVNGRPIQEQALRSGDVVALAGNTMIYVEESSADTEDGEQASETQSYPPVEM